MPIVRSRSPFGAGAFIGATLLLAAACANNDGETDAKLAEGPPSDDARAGEEADSATDASLESPPITSQLYHRAGATAATSLELTSDGTFRWRLNGCDHGGGAIGRWIDEDGAVVLLPRAGRNDFYWPGDGVVDVRTKVILRSAGEGLEADLGYPQSWSPGGRCAQCATTNPVPGTDGGTLQLGPNRTEACEHPFAGWAGPYEPR